MSAQCRHSHWIDRDTGILHVYAEQQTKEGLTAAVQMGYPCDVWKPLISRCEFRRHYRSELKQSLSVFLRAYTGPTASAQAVSNVRHGGGGVKE